MKRQEERQFLKAPAKAAPYGKFVKLWASPLNVRVATGLAENENLQTHSGQKLLPLSIQKNEVQLTPLLRGTVPSLHLVISLESCSEYITLHSKQTNNTLDISAHISDYGM